MRSSQTTTLPASTDCTLEIDGARYPIPRELAFRALELAELVARAEAAP